MMTRETHLDEGEILAYRDGALKDPLSDAHVRSCPLCRVRENKARLRNVRLRNPSPVALSHPEPLALAAYAESLHDIKKPTRARGLAAIRRHLEECFECRKIVETAPGPGDDESDVTVTVADSIAPHRVHSLVEFLSKPSPPALTQDDATHSREREREQLRASFSKGALFPSKATYLSNARVRSTPFLRGTSAPPNAELLTLGTLQIWATQLQQPCTFAYLPAASLKRRPSTLASALRWWDDADALREKITEMRDARGLETLSPDGDEFVTVNDPGTPFDTEESPLWNDSRHRLNVMRSRYDAGDSPGIPSSDRIPTAEVHSPVGAMRVAGATVSLGLGLAGWLQLTAAHRGSGALMSITAPSALASCPLTVQNGVRHRFEDAEEVSTITLATGRHVLRALDPSRGESPLVELALEIHTERSS